jgi:hypothetical protein
MSAESVNIEVHADTREALVSALALAISGRDVPLAECKGAFGWPEAEFAHGQPSNGSESVMWEHEPRFPPEMAVIWHPNAIIPPAVVVEPKAIIYGRVGHSKTVRYRP